MSRLPLAVVTVASEARTEHLRRQQELLDRLGGDVVRVVGWLEGTPPTDLSARVVGVPPGEHGLRVARGRNEAARVALEAGAEVLVFLDADCLPGPGLLGRYADAAVAHQGALLCGPVTYLPEGVTPHDVEDLAALTSPHPARPHPDDHATSWATPPEYDLFWSLSFAITAGTWRRTGGFAEVYEGYGAEDTDFAWAARERAVPMLWVGGAHAYHQWHPTSSPPWQHLDDVLRNGAVFAARWGRWPMAGWLAQFAEAGAIEPDGAGWRRTGGVEAADRPAE